MRLLIGTVCYLGCCPFYSAPDGSLGPRTRHGRFRCRCTGCHNQGTAQNGLQRRWRKPARSHPQSIRLPWNQRTSDFISSLRSLRAWFGKHHSSGLYYPPHRLLAVGRTLEQLGIEHLSVSELTRYVTVKTKHQMPIHARRPKLTLISLTRVEQARKINGRRLLEKAPLPTESDSFSETTTTKD